MTRPDPRATLSLATTASACLWLCLSLAPLTTTFAQQPPSRSAAFTTYFEYLNYHRSKLDAESHPDPARRAAAATHASSLAPKFASLDIDAIRATVRNNRTERSLALNHLGAETAELPGLLLAAEAELAAAEEDAADIQGDARAAADAANATLTAKATWLRSRLTFFRSEFAALTGKDPDSQSADELYWAALALEETRIAAAVLTDPKKRRIAAISARLQAGQLGTTTLEIARDRLPLREAAAAAHKLKQKLRPMPRRIQELSRNPQERERIKALKSLYESEIATLAKRVRQTPPGRSPDAPDAPGTGER